MREALRRGVFRCQGPAQVSAKVRREPGAPGMKALTIEEMNQVIGKRGPGSS